MKAFLAVLGVVAFALAEPPVPSSQYLPSNQYSTTNQDSFAPPSGQYGAPSRPSNSYGAPAFGQTQAVIRPNTQYGAPRPNTLYGAPQSGGGGGYGASGYDDQSEPANYNFEYHVQDTPSGNDFGHQESRQGDVAQGKYYVLLPDGRRQVVEYTADNEGYKPKISYEQVGAGYGGGAGGYQGGGYPSGGGGGYQSGGAGGYQGGNGGYRY